MLGNRQWPSLKVDPHHRHPSCLAWPVSDSQVKPLALQTVGHQPRHRHQLRPPRLYHRLSIHQHNHHPPPPFPRLLILPLHQAILLQNLRLHPAHFERERHPAKKKRRICLSTLMCQAQLTGKQKRLRAVLAGKRGRGRMQIHLNLYVQSTLQCGSSDYFYFCYRKPPLHPLRPQLFLLLPLNLLPNQPSEHATASNTAPSTFLCRHLPAGNLPWSPLLLRNTPFDKVLALSMISRWSTWRPY